ncbi:MAG: phosphate transport system regulatory protein PhoU, partial [Desulfofustis sp.]|nr:phosphate transport system regulatory protein PhoU [Desulfofustis sp.]
MGSYYTFHLELEKLNKKLLNLTALVEDRVQRAAAVIETHDQEQLQSIILSDYEIDEAEIDIEEDCLKILALHQPVASDLRFLITVIKVNNELERIADIAVNIANRV